MTYPRTNDRPQGWDYALGYDTSPEALEPHRKAAKEWLEELEAEFGYDEEEYRKACERYEQADQGN